jgi:predicted GH43/DUF377 family glycosyl hydrolase
VVSISTGAAQARVALVLTVFVASMLASACTATIRGRGAASLAEADFHRVPGTGWGGSTLDVGPDESWYSLGVTMPTVVFDGAVYRMWFVGSSPTTDPSYPYGQRDVLGMATSTDGRSWQLANEGQPVLVPGPEGSPDDRGIAHPFVLRVGDRYMLWYSAVDGTTAGDLGLQPSHVRVERLCLATSRDGIVWHRENGGRPVLDIRPPGAMDSIQVDAPTVIRRGSRFLLWYGGYDGKHSLGLAASYDGIAWTRLNDGKPLSGLSGPEQLGPSVHYDGRQYVLFFQHNGGEGGAGPSWNTYSAVSTDGVAWQMRRAGRAVLGPPPPGSFDSGGVGGNYAVHPSQFVTLGNATLVWYTGEQLNVKQRIGLMRAEGRR